MPNQPSSAALEQLVAAVDAGPTRTLPSRLTGFRHAPAPVLTRGGAFDTTSPDIRIAAATLEKEAGGRTDAASAAATGLAHAAVGNLDGALAEFERAVQLEPTARWLSDLSAVYVARGHRDSRTADYEAAIASADQALAGGFAPALDNAMASACFNRALALEALMRRDEAGAAWKRCLALEADVGWAEEIRMHLTASP
jgi:tetratricopeptide (TPR) repeat protein